MLLRSVCSHFSPSDIVFAIPYRASHYRNHLRPRPNAMFKEADIEADDKRLFERMAPAPKWEPVSANYDPVVNKFVGLMTKKGDRDKAREILRKTFEVIKHTQLRKRLQLPPDQRSAVDVNPILILNKAVQNCTPVRALLYITSVYFLILLIKNIAMNDKTLFVMHIIIKKLTF